MLDFNAWLERGAEPLAADGRASAAWRRIQEKPTEITVVRDETVLDPQTVRIEYSTLTIAQELTGGAGNSGHQTAIVFGIRGHATLPDTDIERNDLFTAEGLQFRIISLTLTTGEIQGMAEVLS